MSTTTPSSSAPDAADMSTPLSTTSPRRVLRSLLEDSAAVVAPGVYDGLSAALAQQAGFSAAYMSGAAVAASLTGLPDLGLATQSELAAQAAVLARTLTIPLLADADTGFGDVPQAVRTLDLYERAGVAAIQLEDQEFPKRCGHLEDKRVVPASEFAAKIEAVCRARRDPDMVVIARTDARAVLGFEEAVARVNLYGEAGADLVFLEAPQTVQEIVEIPTLVKAPAMFNLVTRGKTPVTDLDQLREAGYALVAMPTITIGSAMVAMRTTLERAAGGDLSVEDQVSPTELFDVLGLDRWENLRGQADASARQVWGAR